LPQSVSRQAEATGSTALEAPSTSTADSEPALSMDAQEKQRVVDGAVANVEKYYFDAAVARKTADALRAHLSRGDDHAVNDPPAFADLLTSQMKKASGDEYLVMIYERTQSPERLPGPTVDEMANYREEMKRTNCRFEKVEILPRNIGYVKLNGFADPEVCQATATAAMASLNNADALIFDLRDNRGGASSMVALIATYLFDRRTHLNDFYDRGQNSTEVSWTQAPIPGNKLADKPVYILTSPTTFSAAEGFSYDLKMLKRATIVGERTSGRGHMGMPHRIDDHFTIRIPGIRVTNPISGTNWEGKGVEPDVKVKTADALATAEGLAEKKIETKRRDKKAGPK
jgi:retinol-binding protein 3